MKIFLFLIKGIKRFVLIVYTIIFDFYLKLYCNRCHVQFAKTNTVKFIGHTKLLFGKSSDIRLGEYFRCVSGINYSIDNTCFSKIIVKPYAKLSIGHHSGMTNGVIQCHEQIEIGNYVNIGAGSIIVDSNFHSLNWFDRVDGTDIEKRKNAPVIIKDYVFIGMHSIILKGVTIGEKSIIAAGSVVVKSVPDGEIWGGNPAKFIRKI